MNTKRIPLYLLLPALSSGAWAQTSPAPIAGGAAEITSLQGELAQLRERLVRIEAQGQNPGLISLFNQVETLRAEVSALRGEQQEMAHVQQNADRRQKELFADFDDRLRDLDQRLKDLANRPLATSAEAVRLQPSSSLTVTQAEPVAVDPEAEGKRYDAALALFRAGNYRGAVAGFQEFLRRYPGSALASNAHYWLGLSHFALGEFREAAASQLRLLKDFPLSAKVPDAMVNLARAQIQMGDNDAARATLEQVIARYPVSRAAEVARQVQTLIK